MVVREYEEKDLHPMMKIWNEIVEEGIAFPQEDTLTEMSAKEFFSGQTFCGVAEDESGQIVGMYILHPNNVGRCGHICNVSYVVDSSMRGKYIGKKLVTHCIRQAKDEGFRILQFNAVVKTNQSAIYLYEKLGFTQLGVIPKGFRTKDGKYEDICSYYIEVC